MRRLPGRGEGWGGLPRAARFYYVALPIVIPIIFATVGTDSTATRVHRPLPPPRIDYRLLTDPSPSIPSYPIYLPIRGGDTLETVLLDAGIPRTETHGLIEDLSRSFDPRRLKQNDLVRFTYDAAGNVRAIGMKITKWGNIEAIRTASGFDVTAREGEARAERIRVSATIDTSLYDAIRAEGENAQLVQRLVDVFQWDVDFFRLRKDDHFTLVIDKEFKGEDLTGYGPVLAARFEHRGETYEAFRFETAGGVPGYYTREGAPVRKQFLKSPLRFSRITSGFTNRRFHPILKVFRPHHGVDYGAPVGTPVMSTADGVVVFAGHGRGEGNFVRIRHNSRIETSYLHLSRFGKGIKRGARVRQGEVIGYVGATGLATGPHLDYRVSDGGRWLNPTKMKSITSDPLRGSTLRRFRASVPRLLRSLETVQELASDVEEVPVAQASR